MHDNNDNTEIDTEAIKRAAEAVREFGEAMAKLEEKGWPVEYLGRFRR